MDDEKGLKSSYELAMERLRKNDEEAGVAWQPVTEAQKAVMGHPKVLPLSHCAGATVESQRRAAEIALEQVLQAVRGETPQFVVPELA